MQRASAGDAGDISICNLSKIVEQVRNQCWFHVLIFVFSMAHNRMVLLSVTQIKNISTELNEVMLKH